MLEYLPEKIYDRSGKLIYATKGRDYNDAKLCNADLARANLEGAYMAGADLRGADLRDADLYWAILFMADLEGADLSGACLRGASLEEANFRYAKLQGADMGRDNLDGLTVVEDANFDCAEYDDHTVFPDGFDPKVAGMIKT
jgi:uncharacterized protein YjbI with pentapeptide repeats